MRKVKRSLIILIVFVIILNLVTACSVRDKYVNVLNDYFNALSALDFEKAGLLLGDVKAYKTASDSLNTANYLEYATQKSFLSFIYSSVEFSVLSVKDDSASVQISAYDTADVIAYQRSMEEEFASSQAYVSASVGERYVMLAEFEQKVFDNADKTLSKNTSVVTVKFAYEDEFGYVIKADIVFFDAIAGKRDFNL